jgi:alpha-glucosidase (family GH31 glycosyl hydrolase)
VREADGQPYRIRPFWFHDGLLLDFTHQEGAEWWLSKRAYLLDELGVDGFKTDGGEHLWGRETRFSDGRRGDELLNLYPNLYVGACWRFAQEKRGGDALTFSRAGFTGAQAFPCHWAGDENSTWEALRASLLAGLNAGIAGLPFWGWDIAGFSGEIPTAELYLRSTALAAFCPIMQYHSEFNAHRQPLRDRTPWNIAARTGEPDVLDVYRFYANARLNLLPYIYSEAQHSAQTGLPLMHALWLEYPDDAVCWSLDDQYSFGRSLLVAPVLQEGARQRRVYLPRGRWFDLWSSRVYEGAGWIDCAAPQDFIPVFVREGSVLALNTCPGCELGSPPAPEQRDELSLRLYPAATRATAQWYDRQGRGRTFSLDPHPQGNLQVQVPPMERACTLLVPDSGLRQAACEGRPLVQVESLDELAANTWFCDRGRWVYARLPAAAGPRRLLFTVNEA